MNIWLSRWIVFWNFIGVSVFCHRVLFENFQEISSLRVVILYQFHGWWSCNSRIDFRNNISYRFLSEILGVKATLVLSLIFHYIVLCVGGFHEIWPRNLLRNLESNFIWKTNHFRQLLISECNLLVFNYLERSQYLVVSFILMSWLNTCYVHFLRFSRGVFSI